MGTMRVALYFAPEEESALGAFGRSWLGRSAAEIPQVLPQPPSSLSAARYAEVIEAPRHYGFHGTLKTPFELADGVSLEQVQTELTAFAAGFAAFTLPPLQLKSIGRFLALVTEPASAALGVLHERLVREFDHLRAPLSDFDRKRFLQRGLSPAQEENLLRWGYPYVLREFKFHLTLTGNVNPAEKERLFALLRERTAEVRQKPVPVRRISLFTQADRNAPFLFAWECPLAEPGAATR